MKCNTPLPATPSKAKKLMLTSFACWYPTCLKGFTQRVGQQLSGAKFTLGLDRMRVCAGEKQSAVQSRLPRKVLRPLNPMRWTFVHPAVAKSSDRFATIDVSSAGRNDRLQSLQSRLGHLMAASGWLQPLRFGKPVTAAADTRL